MDTSCGLIQEQLQSPAGTQVQSKKVSVNSGEVWNCLRKVSDAHPDSSLKPELTRDSSIYHGLNLLLQEGGRGEEQEAGL